MNWVNEFIEFFSILPVFLGLACGSSDRRIPGIDCWSQCCDNVCPPEVCDGLIRAGLVSTNRFCPLCDGNMMPTKIQVDISGFTTNPDHTGPPCTTCEGFDVTFEMCTNPAAIDAVSCSFGTAVIEIPGIGVVSGTAYLGCCPLLGNGRALPVPGGGVLTPNDTECGMIESPPRPEGPGGLCYYRPDPIAKRGCCWCNPFFKETNPCVCEQPENCPTEDGLCFILDVTASGGDDCSAGCSFVSQVDGDCPDGGPNGYGDGFDCELRGLSLVNCLCTVPAACACGSASVSYVPDCLPPIEP